MHAELKTMETLLMRRLEKVFEAMDVEDGALFDEITDEMEMLLKLKPQIYNEIVLSKEQLINEMTEATNQVSELAEKARDEIQKRRFLSSELYAIEWEYRKDYLEVIIEIMGKYQMIPYLEPEVTEMQSQYTFPTSDEQEEVEQPVVEQQQVPPQQQSTQPPQQPVSEPSKPIPKIQQDMQEEEMSSLPVQPVQQPKKPVKKIPKLSQNFKI